MSNVELPVFNLDPSTATFKTDDELTAAIASESTGKRFKEGNYSLVIKEARYNRKCADETWMTVKIVLGTDVKGDEREISLYQLFPLTQRIEYKKPTSEKSTLFCWKKAAEFIRGIGEVASSTALVGFLTKYLAGPGVAEPITYEGYNRDTEEVETMNGFRFKNFIGKTLDVSLGYEGGHIAQNDEGQYALIKDGKVVVKNDVEIVGDSYDECQAIMIDNDMEPSEHISSLSVLAILPKKAETATIANSALAAI